MGNSFFERLTGSPTPEDDLGDDDSPEEDAVEEQQNAPAQPQETQEEPGEGQEEVEEFAGGNESEEAANPQDASLAATFLKTRPRTSANVSKTKNPVRKESTDANEVEGQLAIDVYQTDEHVVIKSTIAGIDPKDLDVRITNDTVSIRGTRKKDETVSHEHYYYQECYWGAFSRTIILPMEIDSDNAEAKFKNGILTIRLPKVEKNKEKRVQILSD